MTSHERRNFLWSLEHYVVPDEPFICVFGTSHTVGECQRGDSDRLDKDDVWVTKLKENIGLPLLDLSVRGACNHDFFKIFNLLIDIDKFKNNCKYIIVEGRFGERDFQLDIPSMLNFAFRNSAGHIREAKDQYIKKIRELEAKNMSFDSVADMTDIQKIVPENCQRLDTKYVITLTRNADDINEQIRTKINMVAINVGDLNIYADRKEGELLKFSKEEKQEMRKYIQNCVDINLGSRVNTMLYNTQPLEQIKNVSKILDIPFVWFSFDNYTYGDDTDGEGLFNEETDIQIFNIAEGHYTDLYDYEILKCGGSYCYLIENEELPERCECGHYTESYHAWIADKLTKKVKGEIQR